MELLNFVLSAPETVNFAAIKVHPPYARAVSSHNETGKRYELSCSCFKQVDERWAESGELHHRLLLVLVTGGTEYFKTHPEFETGYNASVSACPLIGIIAIQPTPIATTVDGPEMPEALSEWSIKDPTLSYRAMTHMRTRPHPTAGYARLDRHKDDPVYMYKVLYSKDVESEAVTVTTARGCQGFIPNGVVEIYKKHA